MDGRTMPLKYLPMLRAIIFDFDGVIADTEWLHSETFRRVLAEEGIYLSGADQYERFLGINDRAGFAMAFAEVGREVSPAAIAALVERKSAYYTSRLDEVKPFPGIVELVAALSNRCPLAIASGGHAAEIDAVLRAHGLRERFLAVVSADEVKRSKPAPDPFLEALRALRRATLARATNLAPAECLVIEDSIHGIRGAKAAGMQCLAVAHTYAAERLAEADRVVESIAEVKADDLIREPGIGRE